MSLPKNSRDDIPAPFIWTGNYFFPREFSLIPFKNVCFKWLCTLYILQYHQMFARTVRKYSQLIALDITYLLECLFSDVVIFLFLLHRFICNFLALCLCMAVSVWLCRVPVSVWLCLCGCVCVPVSVCLSLCACACACCHRWSGRDTSGTTLSRSCSKKGMTLPHRSSRPWSDPISRVSFRQKLLRPTRAHFQSSTFWRDLL